MERSILEKQFAIESELVRDESMIALKDFEEVDDFESGCYSSNEFQSDEY